MYHFLKKSFLRTCASRSSWALFFPITYWWWFILTYSDFMTLLLFECFMFLTLLLRHQKAYVSSLACGTVFSLGRFDKFFALKTSGKLNFEYRIFFIWVGCKIFGADLFVFSSVGLVWVISSFDFFSFKFSFWLFNCSVCPCSRD